MILLPHNDNNNFISFLLFKIFELKIVKSQINLIKEIAGNFIGFKKNVNYIEGNYKYKNKLKKIIFPSTVKNITANFYYCEKLEILDFSLCKFDSIYIPHGSFSVENNFKIINQHAINKYSCSCFL